MCKEAVKMHVKHHFILKYFITKICSHLLHFKLEVLPCNIHMLQVLNSYNNDMNNTIIMNKVCMLYYFKVFELNFVEFNNIKEPFDVFSGLERSFAHSSLHTREGYLWLKYILTHDSKQQLRLSWKIYCTIVKWI